MTKSKRQFARYTLAAIITITVLTPCTQAKMFGLDAYVGASLPISSETREMLGSPWINFGVAPTLPFVDTCNNPYDNKASFGPLLEFLAQSKHKNKVFIIRPSIYAKLHIGDKESHFCPYVAASVGPAYISYRLMRNGTLLKRNRIGFGGKAEIGAHIAKKWKIGLNAEYYNKTQNVSFDSVGITLTYNVL